jgi:hypothetical protein
MSTHLTAIEQAGLEEQLGKCVITSEAFKIWPAQQIRSAVPQIAQHQTVLRFLNHDQCRSKAVDSGNAASFFDDHFIDCNDLDKQLSGKHVSLDATPTVELSGQSLGDHLRGQCTSRHATHTVCEQKQALVFGDRKSVLILASQLSRVSEGGGAELE